MLVTHSGVTIQLGAVVSVPRKMLSAMTGARRLAHSRDGLILDTYFGAAGAATALVAIVLLTRLDFHGLVLAGLN